MTDGVAVLDDVLTFLDILDEYFVTCRGVLGQCDLLTIHLNDIALLLGGETYDNAVGGINLQKCC